MTPISTGKKTYEIPFDNGDKCILRFNPTDYRFYLKFTALKKVVSDILVEFEDKRKKVTGKAEEELYDRSEAEIKTAFDDVFGEGAGDQIFKHCSPLSLVDSEIYYPFYFIDAFAPEIVGTINERAQKSAERAKEYKESK